MAALVNWMVTNEPGSYTEDQWTELYYEFVTLKKDPNAIKFCEILKDLAEKKTKLHIIDCCIQYLKISYDKRLVDELRKQGFRFSFNPNNPEQFYHDLTRVTSQSKTLVLKIEQKEAELKAFIGSGEKSATYESFEDLTSDMSQFMHFNINLEETTISKWCSIYNKYVKAATAAQTKQHA